MRSLDVTQILTQHGYECRGAIAANHLGPVLYCVDARGQECTAMMAYVDTDSRGQLPKKMIDRLLALGKLSEPRIASVIDVYRLQTRAGRTRCLIVSRYVAGQSLRSVALESKATVICWERVFTSLIQLLQSMHARGIIHGDISSDNVLVDVEQMQAGLVDVVMGADRAERGTPPFRTRWRAHGVLRKRDDYLAVRKLIRLYAPHLHDQSTLTKSYQWSDPSWSGFLERGTGTVRVVTPGRKRAARTGLISRLVVIPSVAILTAFGMISTTQRGDNTGGGGVMGTQEIESEDFLPQYRQVRHSNFENLVAAAQTLTLTRISAIEHADEQLLRDIYAEHSNLLERELTLLEDYESNSQSHESRQPPEVRFEEFEQLGPDTIRFTYNLEGQRDSVILQIGRNAQNVFVKDISRG